MHYIENHINKCKLPCLICTTLNAKQENQTHTFPFNYIQKVTPNIFNQCSTPNPRSIASPAYHMFIGINTIAISEKEIRPGFPRNHRLNPPNGFGHGPELKSPNTSRSQERSEDHMVPRRHAHHIVDVGVQTLHDPASSPAGPQHHHPRLLFRRGGSEPIGRQMADGFRIRLRTELRDGEEAGFWKRGCGGSGSERRSEG